MKSRCFLALACAAALMAGCNRASNSVATGHEAGTAATAGSGFNTTDMTFVDHMLSDGTAEVELAKIANDHAANPEVKQFAEMMIQDHTKAGEQLKQITSTRSIPVEAKIDDQHHDLMDKLSKARGADFDKQYMDAMIDDHEDAVRDLRSRVDENRSLTDRVTGKNPENPAAVRPEASDDPIKMSINRWAADALPVVERHLDRAKEIRATLDQRGAKK